MGREQGRTEPTELAMARYLVARLAPGELALFDETVAAAPRGGQVKRRRDDPLGFGAVESAAVVFTTVACGVATEVVKSLAEDAGRQAADRTKGWLRRLRPARQSTSPADEDAGAAAASLPSEVLADLRGVARRRALLLGLPEDRAELLADTVVAYLRERTDEG
ncbi:hypothetical protein [Streptomyces sp. NPDC050287]|uniref:hypothetical protein n=1 Tax=Streptomyces sp. NPDC050287 TaxID=3365608 RepID=UPI0037ACA4AB